MEEFRELAAKDNGGFITAVQPTREKAIAEARRRIDDLRDTAPNSLVAEPATAGEVPREGQSFE